jgi:SAM-dependent methyltransferase
VIKNNLLKIQKHHVCFSFLLILGVLGSSEIKAEDSIETVFTEIYDNCVWGSNENGFGISGGGSTLEATVVYREFLQSFFLKHDIHSVVDFGCGDWEFSRTINWDGIDYIGYDVVARLISQNQEKYGAPNIHFYHGNGLNVDLPSADLLVCKDVLQHLSNEDIAIFLNQLHKFKFCLITNDVGKNEQIKAGLYRGLDLTKPPFSLKAHKVLLYDSGSGIKQVFLIVRNPTD